MKGLWKKLHVRIHKKNPQSSGHSNSKTMMFLYLANLKYTHMRANIRPSTCTHFSKQEGLVPYFTYYPNEYFPQTHQSRFLLSFIGWLT